MKKDQRETLWSKGTTLDYCSSLRLFSKEMIEIIVIISIHFVEQH